MSAQHVPVALRELLQTVHRAMGAFAEAIGIAVGNEAPFEARLDDVAQGVVNHPVAKRLMDAALDAQERLYDAQTARGTRRAECLHGADAALAKMRLYLRLAHHWRWLSDGQYRHASQMVAEVGRLLGGWLKQVSA